MIINLTKSKLFTVEPAKRFAKEFNVPEKLWLEIWLRYKLREYTISELVEYVHIRTGRKPSYRSIKRWIIRTEIYSIAHDTLKIGGSVVLSSRFGEYEQDVLNELSGNTIFNGNDISKAFI